MPVTYEDLTDEEKIIADEYRAANDCDYPAECVVCTKSCDSHYQSDNLANQTGGDPH